MDDYICLHYAVENNCLETAELFIMYGANINSQSKGGRSPLMLAMGSDDFLDMVKLLLKYKANVNIKDKENFTAAHLAS